MTVKSIVYRPVAVFKNTTIRSDGSVTTSRGSYIWNCDGTKSGSPVPHYKQAIANLTSATSPYSRVGKDVEWDNVSFSATTEDPGTGKRIIYLLEGYGLNTRPIHTALPTVGSVKGAAVAKFYSKVADSIASFKGLVFLGEMRESLDTVGSYLKLLMGSLRSLWMFLRNARRTLRRALRKARNRKQRRRLIANAEKRIANRYLEFTFGAQPLIADIESLSAVLCEEKVLTERLFARVKEEESNPSHSTAAILGGNVLYNCTVTTKTVVKSSCVGGIKHIIPERFNTLTGTAESLGLSLREVVPSLWELTPFSFLVDYFVNVSDLINTTMYGDTSLYYSCQSTIVKSTVEVYYSAPRKADDRYWTYKVVEFDAGPVRVSLPYWSFTREALNPLNAELRFSLPSNARKWVNMVALFISWAHKFRSQPD